MILSKVFPLPPGIVACRDLEVSPVMQGSVTKVCREILDMTVGEAIPVLREQMDSKGDQDRKADPVESVGLDLPETLVREAYRAWTGVEDFRDCKASLANSANQASTTQSANVFRGSGRTLRM